MSSAGVLQSHGWPYTLTVSGDVTNEGTLRNDPNGDWSFTLRVGGDLAMGFAKLFAEAKYTLGGFSQAGLLVGLRFGGK